MPAKLSRALLIIDYSGAARAAPAAVASPVRAPGTWQARKLAHRVSVCWPAQRQKECRQKSKLAISSVVAKLAMLAAAAAHSNGIGGIYSRRLGALSSALIGGVPRSTSPHIASRAPVNERDNHSARAENLLWPNSYRKAEAWPQHDRRAGHESFGTQLLLKPFV